MTFNISVTLFFSLKNKHIKTGWPLQDSPSGRHLPKNNGAKVTVPLGQHTKKPEAFSKCGKFHVALLAHSAEIIRLTTRWLQSQGRLR